MSQSVKQLYVTVQEAGALLEVPPRTVQRACRSGLIAGELVGGTWLIARTALEQAKESLRDAPALRPELRDRTGRGTLRVRRAFLRKPNPITKHARAA
ncbi:MAG TPA: helix-turn-helix domain-containing protein [Kofleriaceae bacterium]